ncbi:MAG: N-acylglucosamine 2-epimerase [Pseudonocardiales bacterium]|nr:N-acylglucosamine 2-epimerase [Pseudonocardiales bacterium]
MTDARFLAPPPGGPDVRWLLGEARRLIDFARASRDPRGGFGWLSDDGALLPDGPRETYMTARMTHVFALGQLLGEPDCAPLVQHGLDALAGPFRDAANGGWLTALDGAPGGSTKAAYTHAFVVLAASSAVIAGHARAAALLDSALAVVLNRFWDDEAGLVVDVRSSDWATTDPYRGANANMHMVEAMLAAADATGDPAWSERAGRILRRLIGGFAQERAWRLPEHYDSGWQVQPDYNRDDPAHPFRPYGVTIGHLLEWSRLCLNAQAAGPAVGAEPLRLAQGLFNTAVRDGWAVDGAPGFIYTTDWDGWPVVRNRLHWVAAEGIAAAAALWRATGELRYAELHAQWWAYAQEHLIDLDRGSWHHELDPANTPATGTWSGKPDAYHALQAALLPMLPLNPGIALGVRQIPFTLGH